VAKKRCNGKEKARIKQVTAAEVHQLVRESLQEHFDLDMSNRDYDAQDIWDVLIAASVERVTVEMASRLLADSPCGNTVRSVVKEMLADVGQLANLEKMKRWYAGGEPRAAPPISTASPLCTLSRRTSATRWLSP
jgi:hypothetical protein